MDCKSLNFKLVVRVFRTVQEVEKQNWVVTDFAQIVDYCESFVLVLVLPP